MQDVIREVLAAEAEAVRLVAAARARREDLVAEARRRAQDLLDRARREARLDAERVLETARQDVEREWRRGLAQAVAEMEAEVRLEEDFTRGAVDAVVACVCGHHHPM